jgi:hypothetical protein
MEHSFGGLSRFYRRIAALLCERADPGKSVGLPPLADFGKDGA